MGWPPGRHGHARPVPATGRPLKVLVIASRDPGGRQSGRKAVLATIVRSLTGLGHAVEVAAIGPAPLASSPWGAAVPVHRLRPPGPLQIAANVAWRASRHRLSLNECLFYSRRLCAQVGELAARTGAEMVVADMIRTYELAASTGLPVVVDLDDLLSERYRQARAADPETVIGYFADYLPDRLRRPASVAATRLLSVEAALLSQREELVASRAAATCMVSAAEADRLSERVHRRVLWAPMAAPVAPQPLAGSGAPGVVFVGGMDYAANREAVRWYRDEVLPLLGALGLGDVPLDVIGHCSEEAARRLSSERIRFLGYVADLGSVVGRYRVAVAPIVSGTGIKTKVLEAMATGSCVVSTPLGVSGLPVRHGDEVMIGATPAEFASALAEAWTHPEMAAAVGARARRMVERQFSDQAAQDRWAGILRAVEDQVGRPGAGTAVPRPWIRTRGWRSAR